VAGGGLITVRPEVTASGSLIHNELLFEAESAADALPCCVLLTRDALRVDAKQQRHAVPGPLGDWVGGIPALSHVDTAACRRSYGRRASGDAASSGVSPAVRVLVHTRP
jgi:hypothetical protein